MNYYEARQVNPEAERDDAGKWRFTCMNDGKVWPVGACGEACNGHDTAEEACQHYVEGEIAKGVRRGKTSWTTCDNRSGYDANGKPITCPKPAETVLKIGRHGGDFTLCDDHAADNIAEAMFRLNHQGVFGITSSW